MDNYEEWNISSYGVSRERYEQIQSVYGNSLDEESMVEIIETWGAENIEKGYIVSERDGTGIYSVERIDDVLAFPDDFTAAEKAIEDGVQCIPVCELPQGFEEYPGWIDTPENRAAIERYAEEAIR